MHSYNENNVSPATVHAGVAEPSAVSWGAIIAGAIAAAILSLILLILGTGFGFAAVSPWANEGISATTFGITTILWVTFISLVASATGGYLAGRLRSRWVSTRHDEVYFRDTAHGFLSWAVATLITVTLLASAVGSIVGGGLKAGGALVGGVAATATAGAAAAANGEGADDNASGYLWDSLFRRDPGSSSSSDDDRYSLAESSEARSEVARIFVNAIRNDSLPEDDSRYIARVISAHTDISQQEANARVQDAYKSISRWLNSRWRIKSRWRVGRRRCSNGDRRCCRSGEW